MADVTNQKDGGWGWVVVLASFFINFLMDGNRFSFGLLYIEFLSHFDAGKAVVGLVGGIMFGLLLIFAPISGLLVNKFGCRLVAMAGSCLVFLGFFCSAFVTRVGILYLTLGVLGGVGFSMLFMAMYIAIIQRFERYRSIAIGLAVSGSGLGGFAFTPLTNFMIEKYTWRGTLLILSAILLNGCVCGTVMRPIQMDTSVDTDRTRDDNQAECNVLLTSNSVNIDKVTEESDDIHDEYSHRTTYPEEIDIEQGAARDGITLDEEYKPLSEKQSENESMLTTVNVQVNKELAEHGQVNDERVNKTDTKPHDGFIDTTIKTRDVSCRRFVSFLSNTFRFSLLLNKRFVLFIVVMVCINVSFMVPFLYIPDMVLVQFDRVTRTQLVWLPNAMCIANVVSRVPIGTLADMKLVSNVTLMGILCLVSGISCIVMPFCGSYPLLMAACVCYSASIVSAMVLVPVALAEHFGDDVIADSFGLSLFFGGVSGLIGTPFAGWLFDLTEAYELTFIMAGTELLLGGCVLFLIAALRTRVSKDNPVL